MSFKLGRTIRQARKDRGWSLKTFSEKIGISIMTLQRIETGQVSPSIRLMIEISDTLDRPITDFIKDKERTLIRLKSNRIKSWANGGMEERAIFPKDVIEENLGINLAEIKPDQGSEWIEEDNYKGYNLLEGSMVLEFENKKVKLKEGEAVYFDARHRHRLTSDKGAKLVVIYRR